MKIVIFGAAGGIGKQLMQQALDAGHEVTAVVRRPAAIVIQHPRLHVMQGDVLQPESISQAISGNEAVISAIGIVSREPTVLYSTGVTNIMRAMERAGIRRLLCVSAGGLEPGPLWQRIAAKLILWRIFRESYTDLVRMETAVKASSLDWTIVRPPRLTDGPHTGQYHFTVNESLRSGWQISRADLADFMLKQIPNVSTYCSTVEVAN